MTETGLSLGTPHYMSPRTGERGPRPQREVRCLQLGLRAVRDDRGPAAAHGSECAVDPGAHPDGRKRSRSASYGTPFRRMWLRRYRSPSRSCLRIASRRRRRSWRRWGTRGSAIRRGLGTAATAAPEPVRQPLPPLDPGCRLTLGFATGDYVALFVALAAWGWLRPQPVLHPTRAVDGPWGHLHQRPKRDHGFPGRFASSRSRAS